MADNYVQFSVEFPCTSKEQADWLKEEVGSCDDFNVCAELDVEFDPSEESPTSAILFTEEHGDVEMAAEIIQRFLEKFGLQEPVVLEWACTCSKARPGEFGGGAVCIGPDRMFWLGSPGAYVRDAYDRGEGE